MNKKSMSISIVLLVIFTLVLVIVSLTYFITKNKSSEKELLAIPNEVDYITIEGNYLDFYLKNLFEDSSRDIKNSDSKDLLIENMNINIVNYKDYYFVKNLEKIKNQINGNNINLTPEKLVWNVEFPIENNNMAKTGISVKYNYKRKFEKAFKVVNIK